jgi:membrane-associated phospholipid phosphatase
MVLTLAGDPDNMRKSTVALVILSLVLGGWSYWQQGPLPLDLAITRHLQTLIAAQSLWIEWLSSSAGWPMIVVSALVVAVFAASLAGLRGAAGALAGIGLAMAAERGLRMLIFVPRPDPALVDVAKASASSGLPSTFAIFYGAAAAALVLTSLGKRGREAQIVRWGAVVLLVAGCVGRVAAGGHWTSQVVASAALGALASLAAMHLFKVVR